MLSQSPKKRPLSVAHADRPSSNEDPPKRSRLAKATFSDFEELQAEVPTNAIESEDSNTIKRDGKYYFTDGDCVIRVKNTLFNVHRYRLLQNDLPTFLNLVSSQETQKPRGSTDDNPIVLQENVDVRKFRNFLWAFYAMPYELRAPFESSADIDKLLDIAEVAERYSVKLITMWACDCLQQCVALKESDPLQRTQYKSIIRFAQLCQHEKLLQTIVNAMQNLLTTDPSFLRLALSVVDELTESPVPSLTGVTYYSAVLRDRSYLNTNDIPIQQQLRILKGYHGLTVEWEGIRVATPEFSHVPSCSQGGRCQIKNWNAFWKGRVTSEKVMSLSLADVGGRMKMIVEAIDRLPQIIHDECKEDIKRVILAKIATFEEHLADYFPPN